ncbi:glycosyltransferase, partial [Rhizobium johnstonii]
EDARLSAPEPKAIAAAIIDLMNDPVAQEALSAATFERSRELYTWEGVNSAYEEALRELVSMGTRVQ